MRLREVRDLSTRAVTQYDVLFSILFGGKPPQAFDPTKFYTTGDVVYYVKEDGTVVIVQANTSGIFPSTAEPNFSQYNLTDVIEKQKETIEKLTGIRSKISEEIYIPKTFEYTLVADTPSGSIGEWDIPEVKEWINDYHYIEVYLSGRLLPTSPPLSGANYAGYSIEVTEDSCKIKFTKRCANNTVMHIRVNRANSLLTRMVNRININAVANKSSIPVVDSTNYFNYMEFAVGKAYTISYARQNAGTATKVTQRVNIVTCNAADGFTANGTVPEVMSGKNQTGIIIAGDLKKDILPLLPKGQFITASTSLPNASPFFLYFPIGKYPNDSNVGLRITSNPSLLNSEGVLVVGIGLWIPVGTAYTNQKFTVQIEPGQKVTPYTAYSTHLEYGYDKVKIPYPVDPTLLAMQYDLYINCTFTPANDVRVEKIDGEYYLTDWPGKSRKDGLSFDFVFAFAYSVSNEMQMLKQDLVTTVTKKNDKFIVDLTPVDFANSFQEVHAFVNDRCLPVDRYVLNKGRMNIPNEDGYFSDGDKITVTVWSYILTDYNAELIRHNSQSVPVLTNGTLRSVIPFLGYDERLYDVLVFNDSGVYLSFVKWFVDGYDMQYFLHDEGINFGNILDFRLIDADSSVQMQNFYMHVEADDQDTYPINADMSVFAFYMLFNANGEYIPTDKYQIDGSQLILDHERALVRDEDVLELVAFRYVEDMTSTAFGIQKVYSSENDQAIFINPYKDYDPNTDSLLIFTHEGMYVGERFYSIVNDSITLQGSTIPLGGYLEIIRIRNTSIFNKVIIPEDILDKGMLRLDNCYGDEVPVVLANLDLVSYEILSENDGNYLRTKATKLEVTASCDGKKYPATVVFSGTRCLLQIATTDLEDGTEGVVSGNTIHVTVRAVSKVGIRNYVFDIYIDPKDLHKIELTPATSTGEPLIQPALQKLMRAFPLKDIEGMTDTYLALIENANDVRISALFNNERMDVSFTHDPENNLCFNFGELSKGGIIEGTIILNMEEGGDYLFTYTIDVTKPWYLVTTLIRESFIKLTELESSALKFKGFYGKTYQYTSKGNNYVDIRRFVSDSEATNNPDIDLSGGMGGKALNPDTVSDLLGDRTISPGVRIAALNYRLGSIKVVGDGSVADQRVSIPLLGLMDRKACYAIGYDYGHRTSQNGDSICSLVITYGEASSPGKTWINLRENILSAGVDLNNFNNLISVNLVIYTNQTNNHGVGYNEVTIEGLRMNRVPTALSRVEEFEPYTGMAPSPNLYYPQEITGVGQKTYNLFDEKAFCSIEFPESPSFNVRLEWDSQYWIKFKSYTNTLRNEDNRRGMLSMGIDRKLLKENHVYKLFYDSNITSDVTYELLGVSDSNVTAARTIIYNSAAMSHIAVRLSFGPGAAIDLNRHKLRIWVVDVTDDPDKDWGYEPMCMKSVIYVKSGNIVDFSRIGSVMHSEEDKICFKSNTGGRYDIYIEPDVFDEEYFDDQHIDVGPVTYQMSHEESLEVFEAGTYAILSGDKDAQLNPMIYLSVSYNDETFELGNSGVYRKMEITEEMRMYDDFCVSYGFKINPTIPITERAIYPMVIKSSGNGDEWIKEVNSNNVLVMDFCNYAHHELKLFHDDYLYGRNTNLVNHFDPTWIPSKAVNGVTITNLNWGGFKITGTRQNQANTIQSQKSFSHVESLSKFKPGYYLMASCDSLPALAPYVYMRVRTGVDGNLVASTTSMAFTVCEITEEMTLDRYFAVEIGIIAEGSNPTLDMRTIMPMLLYSSTDNYPWKPTDGILKTNFVPYYSTPTGTPVDVDTDRYGYSGNGFFLESGGGSVYQYKRVIPFRTSELPGSWSVSDPLDPADPTKHGFIYSGFANHIIPSGYGGADGSDIQPDILCDRYVTVPSCRRRELNDHISLDEDGNLWIVDDDYATMSAADFTTLIRDMDAKLLLPMHSDTYVKREYALQLNQENANALIGYAPIMYIGTTFEPPHFSSSYPVFELTYERRQDT